MYCLGCARFWLTLDVWSGFKEIRLHLMKDNLYERRDMLKELSLYKCLSVNAALNFADKALMALCYSTIVLKSSAVESKDFLILALSTGISLL